MPRGLTHPASHYRANWAPYSAHQQVCEHVPHGSKVLDVGCASGYLAARLIEKGCTVTGVDGNIRSAREAERFCEKVHVRDLQHGLDFISPDTFHVIVMADILEHLEDPLALLQSAVKRLEKGGRIVISVPNVAHVQVRFELLCGRFDYTPAGICDTTHLRFFTERSVIELLNHAGLRVKTMSVTPGLYPLRWYRATFHRTFHDLRRYDDIVFAICNRFRKALGYQFVIVAEPA